MGEFHRNSVISDRILEPWIHKILRSRWWSALDVTCDLSLFISKKNLSSSRKASRFSLSITGDVLCFQVLGEGTCCNQKSLRKSVLDFLINIVTWIIVVHNPVSVSAGVVASSSEKWNKHLSSRSRTVTRRPMGLQFTWPSLIVRVSRRDVSDFQNLCS